MFHHTMSNTSTAHRSTLGIHIIIRDTVGGGGVQAPSLVESGEVGGAIAIGTMAVAISTSTIISTARVTQLLTDRVTGLADPVELVDRGDLVVLAELAGSVGQADPEELADPVDLAV